MTVIADTVAESRPAKIRTFVDGGDERLRPAALLALAGLLWLGAAGLILAWPDAQELERTTLLGVLAAGLGVAQLAAWGGGWRFGSLARLSRLPPRPLGPAGVPGRGVG